MTRIQRTKGRRRLVSEDDTTLAVLNQRLDGWRLSVYTRDGDGRRACGVSERSFGEDVAAGERELVLIAPQLDALHRMHSGVAEALASAAFAEDAAFTTAGDMVFVPACAFVRLLGDAARGDVRLQSLLHKAGKHEGVSADTGAELAEAGRALADAQTNAAIVEAASAALGYPEREALQDLLVAALQRLVTLGAQYDELVEAVGCGTNTAHSTVVAKARGGR